MAVLTTRVVFLRLYGQGQDKCSKKIHQFFPNFYLEILMFKYPNNKLLVALS